MMMVVEYPDTKPKVRLEDGAESVFCMIRKKWFRLSPEEWVRQNFLLYLTEKLEFPASLIAVEKQINIDAVKRRFDIVVYDRNAQPYMLIECKEMDVQLTSAVLLQALHYHATLQTQYLVITNGNSTFAYQKVNGDFESVNHLKLYA